MRFVTRERGKVSRGWPLLTVCARPNGQKTNKNKLCRGGTREVSQVTCAHRGYVMKAKAPKKIRQKETQAKKANRTEKREQKTNIDTPAKTQQYNA